MYRKILLALIACLAMAVPAALAYAEDEGVDDSPVASTDEGAPPAPDKLPPAGNYSFQVQPKSTITLNGVCGASEWGVSSPYPGTINSKGKVNIPGSGLTFPEVTLKGCILGAKGWFQGEKTGTHDVPHPPDGWTAQLSKAPGGKGTTLTALILSKSHTDVGGVTADCLLGEIKRDGKTTGKIKLDFKGTYKPSGTNKWLMTLKNKPTLLPYPFRGVTEEDDPACDFLELVLGNDDPLTYNLKIMATKVS